MAVRMPGAAMVALAVVSLVAGAGAADDRQYDRKLAEAAAEIVAARMGPLRGGFSAGEQPALYVLQPQEVRPVKQPAPKPPAPGEWRDGLAIAVEKKSRVSPDL